MSWDKKTDLKKLRQKAEKAVVTDVERELDEVRDIILTEARKMGGWSRYISNRQKGLPFTDPRK